jgi:hypothetical protein
MDPEVWPTLRGTDLEAVKHCVHEASHALTAEQLELPRPGSVTAVPGWEGQTHWRTTVTGSITPERWVAVALAGEIAERHFRFPDPGGPASAPDRELAFKTAAGWPGALEEGRKLALRTVRYIAPGIPLLASRLNAHGRLAGDELGRAIDAAMRAVRDADTPPELLRQRQHFEKRREAIAARQRFVFEEAMARLRAKLAETGDTVPAHMEQVEWAKAADEAASHFDRLDGVEPIRPPAPGTSIPIPSWDGLIARQARERAARVEPIQPPRAEQRPAQRIARPVVITEGRERA